MVRRLVIAGLAASGATRFSEASAKRDASAERASPASRITLSPSGAIRPQNGLAA
jgi:hypothetical protein